MVDMQQFFKYRFIDPTPLACMPITSTSAPRLLVPVWAIVRIETAAPCRVLIAAHALAVRFGEASPPAKALAASLQLVWLAFKWLAARRANHSDSRWLCDQAMGALPGSAALTRAEIVRTGRAGRQLFTLAAPFAGKYERRMATFFRAVVRLLAFGMPARAIEWLVASRAYDQHKSLLYGVYMLNYIIKERTFVGYEKNIIGAACLLATAPMGAWRSRASDWGEGHASYA